jgi:uncharacterized protein (TIGR02808 family)
MSAAETLFWNLLGYSSMALIFVVGFAITAVIACFLLEIVGRDSEKRDG